MSLVSGVDYEAFVFPISMHESLLDFDSQFSLYNYEHANMFSHNEHEVKGNYDICMHYENEGVNSIFPSSLFQNANMTGGIDGRDVFSLPHESVDENQVYDRGKKF